MALTSHEDRIIQYRIVGTIVLSAALLAGAYCGSKQPQPPHAAKTKVFLIWCDVTSSLKGLENAEAAKLTAEILDSLPTGAKYAVYPIQTETGRPVPIIKGEQTPEPAIVDGSNQSQNIARANLIRSEVSRLYKENTEKDPYDKRTCILNTLDVSAKFFSQFVETSELELIFVSDMIEDCGTTPMHKNVQLDKQPVSETVKLVNSFPSPPDLSHVRVTIIVPTARDTPSVPVGQRPDPRDLEMFWRAVFLRCHFKEDDFNNKDRFYWSVEGLPQRFLATLRESQKMTTP